MVESGVNWINEDNIQGVENESAEYNFFKANYGKEKLFPGGPTCTYKGIKIPAVRRDGWHNTQGDI